MGGVANTVGRIGSGVFTLGASEIARKNMGRNNLIRNALGLPGTVLTGGLASKDQMPALFGGGDTPNPYISGPFTLDPNQLAMDKEAILGEGRKQYDETIAGIGEVSAANTKRARELFAQTLPDIAENSQAAHLYDSTGYGQEVARQQAALASDVANREAELKFNALGGRQGFQTGALQRGLSLEDFINQANVAKTIGAQTAPQVGNGKGATGQLLGGVGAVAQGFSGFGGKGAGTKPTPGGN